MFAFFSFISLIASLADNNMLCSKIGKYLIVKMLFSIDTLQKTKKFKNNVGENSHKAGQFNIYNDFFGNLGSKCLVQIQYS